MKPDSNWLGSLRCNRTKKIVVPTESTGSRYCGNELDHEIGKDEYMYSTLAGTVFSEVIPNMVLRALGISHELVQLPIGRDARGLQARRR